MKSAVTNLVFDPIGKTITFSPYSFCKLERLDVIINMTTGQFIYRPDVPELVIDCVFPEDSNVLTFSCDTTGMNADDLLYVRYNGDPFAQDIPSQSVQHVLVDDGLPSGGSYFTGNIIGTVQNIAPDYSLGVRSCAITFLSFGFVTARVYFIDPVASNLVEIPYLNVRTGETFLGYSRIPQGDFIQFDAPCQGWPIYIDVTAVTGATSGSYSTRYYKTQTFTSSKVIEGIRDYTTLSVTGLNNDLVSVLDVSGFRSAFIQVAGTFVGTLTFQGSNDNVTYVSVSAINANTDLAVQTTTAVGLFEVPIKFKYLRVRMTAFTSGTATGVMRLSAQTLSPPKSVTISNTPAVTVSGTPSVTAASAQSGAWSVSMIPLTTGGLTRFRLLAAATTNSNLVKTGATQLYVVHAYNNTASVKFLKLYNKATAPTVGTDTPLETYPLAPNAMTRLSFEDIGDPFALGLGIGLTGALADADTTALAANDVILNMHYK